MGDQTAEAKLVANILNDIKNYCDEKNATQFLLSSLMLKTLTRNQKSIIPTLVFKKYMLKNYQIKVFNGYEPFFEKSIKRATYSLTDVHSNCKGYEIYANWLLNLN